MSQYGQPTFINRTSAGAIEPYRFVAGTADDGVVGQGAAGTDALVGASGQLGASAADQRIDIAHEGIVPLQFGAAVVFGDLLTSDEDGKAVPAGPGDRIGAVALENGDADVIGTVRLIAGGALAPGAALGALAFAAGDCAPAAADLKNGGIYQLGATAANSTLTLPAATPNGTTVTFVADGVDNGHTITVRDATGPTAITAALTASKRLRIQATKVDGIWVASAAVGP